MGIPPALVEGPEALVAATREILEQVWALPAVERASTSSIAPLCDARMVYSFEIPDYQPVPADKVRTDATTVEDDSFRTVGLLASCSPARRAAQVDSMIALRAE